MLENSNDIMIYTGIPDKYLNWRYVIGDRKPDINVSRKCLLPRRNAEKKENDCSSESFYCVHTSTLVGMCYDPSVPYCLSISLNMCS